MQIAKSSSQPCDVLHYMFFPGGGIGRYVNELCNAQIHVDPELIVRLACSENFAFLSDARYQTWPFLCRLDSRFVRWRKARFLAAQFISPRRFLLHARESHARLLHFSNINHLSYAVWRRSLLKLGIPVCCTAHDVRRRQAIVSRRWEDRWLRRFYADCGAIFVHSNAQREELLEFACVDENRVHIVPHGVYAYPQPSASGDELRSKYRIPQDRPVGLFFGFLRDDKNLPALLEALARLNPRPFLLVAGSTASGSLSLNDYQALVSRLGLENDVEFLSRHIDDEEVGNLFAMADFVPMTYKTTFTSQSGVLNVAAYYGKPMLVTASPTMSETVQRYGIGEVCEADTPIAIANGLHQILNNLNKDWSHAFNYYATDHSWATAAKMHIEIYKTLLNP